MTSYSHALPRLRIKRPSPPGWSTWWKGMMALLLLQAGHAVIIRGSIILLAWTFTIIAAGLFIFRLTHDMWKQLEEQGRARPVPKAAWLWQALLWAWTLFVWAVHV